MDNANIETYASNFAYLILNNVGSIPKSKEKISPALQNINENDLLVLTTEFLFYELHVCDRFFFLWYGAEIRGKMMDMIVGKIATVLDENREYILDEELKMLDLKSLRTYLYITSTLPDFEAIIEAYNQRQAEYSKYDFWPKEDKQGFAGELFWEFAKKLALLIKKEEEVFLKMGISAYAMAVYEMIVKFKDGLDEHFKNKLKT